MSDHGACSDKKNYEASSCTECFALWFDILINARDAFGTDSNSVHSYILNVHEVMLRQVHWVLFLKPKITIPHKKKKCFVFFVCRWGLSASSYVGFQFYTYLPCINLVSPALFQESSQPFSPFFYTWFSSPPDRCLKNNPTIDSACCHLHLDPKLIISYQIMFRPAPIAKVRYI